MATATGKAMGKMSLGSNKFAPRPAVGSAGRPVKLLANVFALSVSPNLNVSQYDIRIVPVRNADYQGDAAAVAERALPIALCREIFRELPVQHPSLAVNCASAAYDGRKICFIAGRFNFDVGPQDYEVSLQPNTDGENARQRKFTVTFAFTQSVDVSALASRASQQNGELAQIAIQAVDVLLRHDPSINGNHIIAAQGRKFLDVNRAVDIGQAAEILKGFFMSVRPSMNGPVVNIDVAQSPFRQAGSLTVISNAILGRGSAGPAAGRGRGRGGRGGFSQPAARAQAFSLQERRHLELKLKGSKLKVTHRVDRKPYIFQGFGRALREESVTIRDGPRPPAPDPRAVARGAATGARLNPRRPEAGEQVLSMTQYFQTKYNLNNLNPDLPVVIVRGNNKLPFEVVEILRGNSISPTKLTREQASSMIDVARTTPAERKIQIEELQRQRQFDQNPRLLAWKLSVADSMTPVDGRVLPPPTIMYNPASKNKIARINNGAWNLIDSKFTTPVPLKDWAVIVFGQSERVLPGIRSFITSFGHQLGQRGISVQNAQPSISFCEYDAPEATLQALKDTCRPFITQSKKPPQLIILMLNDSGLYDQVKRQAAMDLPVPIASQALLLKNVLQNGPKAAQRIEQYCGNVAMKVNLKLGGQNWTVGPTDLPKFVKGATIVFGADVTHPPAVRGSEMVAPSIAAVVANRNDSLQTFATQIRQQTGRLEMITDLADMVFAHLQSWQQGKIRPSQIIFFRDGVSEGQYSQVVDHEVSAIKEACRRIQPGYNPKLVFVVATKRHNMRFFAQNAQDNDRTGNLPAGTVVDQNVVSPLCWDFYLQAHAGLIGTARPTRYSVLLDEVGFNSNDMQKMINSICSTFARATRSVSLVSPAYSRSFVYMDDDAATTVSGGSGMPVVDAMRIQNSLARGGGLPLMWYM